MKLLPCPFCGGEPEEDGGMFFEFYGHERQDYSIACKKCRAEVRCDVGEHEGADAPCSCHHDTRKICAEKWNRRAAMLQGADRPQNEPQNIPENIPATQFKPVADLYGLTSPTGGETSFTFDAVEARDFIDGGWSCQEYVELGRYQEALTDHSEDKLAMVDHSGDSNNMVEPVTTACKLRDAVDTIRNSGIAIDGEKILAERDALNSPVIPDGWVAVPVEPTIAILDEFDSIIDYGAEDSKDAWSRLLAAAWIKSLPAAPQQEVESQIRKGKTVAREEWELGARLTKHRFKP
ncbi:Lar family restriction alleviation protein [Enterobacter roggenkampii]|uniref:Lar family restriction alleviation protein n=1 Tax=Enterobacter roggenkampii TaxID=1812935 RepID=UPI001C648AAB|nr:Lar family restriction alleviation protein [Enterobacter roggenkampii]MBW7748568.1 Lar family restriction alleviation protein [Enterobacter roggenkampii]